MAQASASREMGRLREAFVARLRRSVRLLSRQHEKVHGAGAVGARSAAAKYYQV